MAMRSFAEHGIDKVLFWRINSENNCLEGFVKEFEKIALDIYNRKQSHQFFRSNFPVPKESVNDCWICNKPTENDQQNVLDHCHYSDKFVVWAHFQCSLLAKSIDFNPVIAHNMAGYDLRHICTIINSNSNHKFSVLSTTDQKHISRLPSG